MSKITEIIGSLREQWGVPRKAFHRGRRCPFLLACSFASEPAGTLEQVSLNLPEDVREFWLAARSATLFKDRQFGQWGIEVLDPDQALRETSRQVSARQRDFVSSDLVLARFFGDSDLVVIACDPEQSNFGAVTIALPIDRRLDWPVVAASFGDFLEKLVEAMNFTRQPKHKRCQRLYKRWSSFSATNTSKKRSKARLLKLNKQTPCPPRDAVPVNTGRPWEFFTLFLPVRTSVMPATAQLCCRPL
jgi:hypothetical protein